MNCVFAEALSNNGMHPTPHHAASHVPRMGARVMPALGRIWGDTLVLWPREFVIIETVVLLGFVFVCAFFITLYINLVTETPALRYLISSALVSVAAFWLPNIIGNFTLPPLRWFNGEPQDLRTAVFDRLIIICAVSAVLCYIGWQFMVRNRKCRFRV